MLSFLFVGSCSIAGAWFGSWLAEKHADKEWKEHMEDELAKHNQWMKENSRAKL